MANATSRVLSARTNYGDDLIKRGLAATATSYYTGAMIAINTSGYAVKCDDTAGLVFDGLVADSVKVEVESTDSAGDKKVNVARPFRFSMTIASAAITDIGKPVYAKYDNEVAFTATNGVLVGWVDSILSATEIMIRPAYLGRRELDLSGVGSLASAGSAQGDAAQIVDAVTVVTGADGTKGVILPAAVAGLTRLVYNSVATNGLKIYPASGDDINDGTQDAAITIEGKTLAVLVAVDSTTWAALYTVNT